MFLNLEIINNCKLSIVNCQHGHLRVHSKSCGHAGGCQSGVDIHLLFAVAGVFVQAAPLSEHEYRWGKTQALA